MSKLFSTPPPDEDFLIVKFNIFVAERMPVRPLFGDMTLTQVADLYHPSSLHALEEVVTIIQGYDYDMEYEPEEDGLSVIIDYDTEVKFYRRRKPHG